MERRHFITLSLLAAGGLLTKVTAGIVNDPRELGPEELLKLYLDRTAAIHEPDFKFENTASAIFDKEVAAYSATGYTQYKTGAYLLKSKDDCVLIPLVLRTEALGSIDSALLFFRKDVQGIWRYSRALSGFHLEAIERTVASLGRPVSSKEMVHHTAPVIPLRGPVEPGKLLTAAGYLDLTTKIDKGRAVTEFTLVGAGLLNVADKFNSRHYLGNRRLLS